MSTAKRVKLTLDAGDDNEAASLLMALPPDVRVNIAGYLSSTEIFRLARINKNFDQWSKTSRDLWVMLYRRNFGDEMSLVQLKQVLYTLFPNIGEGFFAQDNYRALVLAYAIGTMPWGVTLSNTDVFITTNEVSINIRSRNLRESIDKNILTVIKQITNGKVNIYEGTSGHLSINLRDMHQLLGASTRLILLVYFIQMGFNMNNHTRLDIKSQCVACSKPAKYRSETTGELFCSQECTE